MPRFSVIVTTYNDDRFIEQCIRSVLNQTYTDFELIIVNDGSTDNTTSILSKLQDERITLINQENHGTVYSREKGICTAIGDYLLFVDADDWWEPNLLESVNAVVNDTDADIIQFGYMFRDENGNSTLDAGIDRKGALSELVYSDTPDDYAYVALEMCYSLWSRAFKRTLFDMEQGFYEPYYDVRMTNDLLAFARPLSLSQSYCFMDKYLYNYRIVSDSMCHTVTIDKVDSYFRSITWAEKCMYDVNGLTDNHREFFAKRLATIIFDEYREVIYREKASRIRRTYKLAKLMPWMDGYLTEAVNDEGNWYRKLFLKSFVHGWILVPKILILYANMKSK